MKAAFIATLIMSFAVTASTAGDRPTAAERAERRDSKIANAKERQADAEGRQKELREHIEKATAMEFEKKNSDKDLLRGRITYSMPSKEGDGFTAFVFIRWGDLDNQIPDIKSEHYSNWDGYVKVQEGGKASVVKEFAFDDRNGTTGGVERRDGIGRDSGRRPGEPGEPGAGSGQDKLIRDSGGSMVAWKSGVVGATDGLLIRLDLKKAETRGSIKAGNFTVYFDVKPRP